MAKTEKDPEILALAKGLNGVPWCDEYELMVSGMMYSPLDPTLLAARHRARCLSYKYNNLDPATYTFDKLIEVQSGLLAQMLGRVGSGTVIEPPLLPDYGSNTIVGSDCFINFNMTILDTSLVIIGDRVQIGPNVSIYSAGHGTSVLSRVKFVEFGHPVRIEDDCWIGGGVTILPGVTIGKGSTVGAGAVVSKSIPPYSVALGAPAKVYKKLPTLEEELADPNNPYVKLPDRS